MAVRSIFNLFTLLIILGVVAISLVVFILLLLLIVRACQKNRIKETPVSHAPPSPAEIPVFNTGKTLPERLKEARLLRGMTQEFVAESLHVSRQAVSKWETGAADPSTSNLLALAKLYGVSAADLLP